MDNEPVIVSGVKGAQKTPFTKRFQDESAYEEWRDSDAAKEYQVDTVMNEGAVTMKYYNVYETADGAKIPFVHKIYTNESAAKADGRRIMLEGSYRNFAVFETAVESKPLDRLQIGRGDTRSAQDLKQQIRDLPNETLKKWAKDSSRFGTKVKKMQDKLVKSEMRRRGLSESEEPVMFNGKKFTSYKRFKTDKQANKFLEKNEQYGVIGKKDGMVYVAKNADLGESTVNQAKKYTLWDVNIGNNYKKGSTSDFGYRAYPVLASSKEEAKKVVLDNADAILKDLITRKKTVGPRTGVKIDAKNIGTIEPGEKRKRTSRNPDGSTFFSPDGPMKVKLKDGIVQETRDDDEESEFSKRFYQATADSIKDQRKAKKKDEVKEASNTGERVIQQIKSIVDNKQAKAVPFEDGKTKVDMYTASAVAQVYDAASDRNKEKILDMISKKAGFMKLAEFAFGNVRKNEGVEEGYKTLPAIDQDRYDEIPGMEGPFRTLSGHVVYYDPKAGEYYDRDRDMYIDRDEFRAMDNDYSDMKDERDIPVREAVAKIACTQCDEVSTAAAWKKNNGFCPKCKTSSQGVAESVNEGLAHYAQDADRDHEVQMARSDLYKLAEYSIKLHNMLKNISEAEGIMGWQQAKITKAADYISSVYHSLKYDQVSDAMAGMNEDDNKKMGRGSAVSDFEGSNLYKELKGKDGVVTLNLDLRNGYDEDVQNSLYKYKRMGWLDFKRNPGKGLNVQYKVKMLKPGIERVKDLENFNFSETTTAGGIAAVSAPLGKMQRRKKKK